jgi:hypothetical protein
MDLQKNDVTAGEVVGGAIDIGKSIQEKAILKKAKKLIAAGRANECTGRMIDVCLENGIPASTFDKNPLYLARPNVIAAKAAASKAAGSTDEQAIDSAKKDAVTAKKALDLKKYLPIILVVVGFALIVFFIKTKR